MAGRGPSPKSLAAQRVPPAAPAGSPSSPRAPKGLHPAGRALWKAIQERWKLDPRETAVLERCCRLADVEQRLFEALESVEVVVAGHAGQEREHPLLNRYVQTNLALGRLLSTLNLPGGELVSLTSARAGNAAAARWKQHNTVKAQRQAMLSG
jgi:hypothetical protein